MINLKNLFFSLFLFVIISIPNQAKADNLNLGVTGLHAGSK
jgi:hypothetical protein